MRFTDLSDDEVDNIIARAHKMGIRVPKTEPALTFALTVMAGRLCTTRYDLETLNQEPTKDWPDATGTTCEVDEEFHEVDAHVCHNGCCINFICVPDHISTLAAIMVGFGQEEKAEKLLRKHSYIVHFDGMN